MVAGGDGRPALALGRRGLVEGGVEPRRTAGEKTWRLTRQPYPHVTDIGGPPLGCRHARSFPNAATANRLAPFAIMLLGGGHCRSRARGVFSRAVAGGIARSRARDAGNQVVLLGRVVVPQGQSVGEVVVFSGQVAVEGIVRGDVVVVRGAKTVSGQVSGSVVALGWVRPAAGHRAGGRRRPGPRRGTVFPARPCKAG